METRRDVVNEIHETSGTVEASDGHPLRLRCWEGTRTSATVLFATGVMSHSGWLRDVARRVAERGFRVVGADRRGSGEDPIDRGDAPSAGVLLDDLQRVAEAQPGDQPLFLMGWCWGACLVVNACARATRQLDGLILATPGIFSAQSVRARFEAEIARTGIPDTEAALASPIEEEMFTRGPQLEDYIRRDPHRLRRLTPRFYRVMAQTTLAASGRLRRLELPVLLLLASDDEAVDNGRTEYAFTDLPRASVRVKHLPGRHGMAFDAPQEFAAAITDWLRDSGSCPAEE
jgi:alpha-beta hydrolase superfamily lysophospholipase